MHNSIGIIVVVKSFASSCHHRLIRSALKRNISYNCGNFL